MGTVFPTKKQYSHILKYIRHFYATQQKFGKQVNMSKAIMAWWFCKDNKGSLNYGDKKTVTPGTLLEHKKNLFHCGQGLHAYIDILHALAYSRRPFIWRVKLSGKTITKCDKVVSQFREHLWTVDCSEILDKFARACILDAVHLWENCPDNILTWIKHGGNKEAKEILKYLKQHAAANATLQHNAFDVYRATKFALAYNTVWPEEPVSSYAAWAAEYVRYAFINLNAEKRKKYHNKQSQRLTSMIIAAHKENEKEKKTK